MYGGTFLTAGRVFARHCERASADPDAAPFSQRLTVAAARLASDGMMHPSESPRSAIPSATPADERAFRLASSAATPRRVGGRFAASRTDAQLCCCPLKILRCDARHLVTARVNAVSSIAARASLDSSARSNPVDPSLPVVAVSSAVLAGSWGSPVSPLFSPVSPLFSPLAGGILLTI